MCSPIGRSCIDLYAHEIGVPITDVTSFDAYVGGCPTNISVGTRRLGLRSALLTAVGDDQVGDFVPAFLEREGVETRFIPRKPGRRTSAVILTIQPPDQFPLTFYRDNCADRELTIDDVRARARRRQRVVVVTGTGLSHEPATRRPRFRGRSRASAAGREVLRRSRLPAGPVGQSRQTSRGRCSACSARRTRRRHRRRADRRGGRRRSGAARSTLLLRHRTLGADREARRARRDDLHAPGREPRDVPPFPIEVLNVLGAGDAFASGFICGIPAGVAARARGAHGQRHRRDRRHAPRLRQLHADDAEVDAFVAAQGGW